MEQIFFGLFSVLIESLCVKMFLDIFLEKKKESNFIKLLILMSLLGIIVFLIAVIFSQQYFLKVPFLILVEVLFWKWYYKDSAIKIAVIYIIFFGTAFLLDYFTSIAICTLNPQVASMLENSDTLIVLVTILGKVSDILFILLLWRLFKKKRTVQTDLKGWLYTFVFSIFTIVVMITLASNWTIAQNDTQANVLLSISIGLVIMNIFMFYVINNILEAEAANREKDIFKERLEREIETYQTVEENAVAQRALIHEFRNILSVITASKDKSSDVIIELAKAEAKKLGEDADVVNTKNVIVNMVLNAKVKEIRKKKIGILLEADDLSDLKMENEDIVIILSNLINNAIEACEQCKNKKMIWIKCFMQGTETFFSVRNTYGVEPVVKNGKYTTTKTENQEMHGMGINNIIKTVEKYQGSYVIHTENNEFLFTITIPA